MRRARPAVALAAVTAALAGCGAGDDVAPTPKQAAEAVPERVGTGPGEIRPAPLRPGQFSATVDRPLAIRATPGGRIVGRALPRTRFGTQTRLAVAGRQGNWLAVMTEVVPGNRPGWIPVRATVLQRQPYTVEIDRSARTLSVRRGATVVRSFAVGVGAPGTPTPLGRAGITDALVYPTGAGPYGCCAVALTSHQRARLPGSWKGGTQIAIHGTADESVIGRAVSLGCVRGRNTDLRWVIRNVPAGALVTTVP